MLVFHTLDLITSTNSISTLPSVYFLATIMCKLGIDVCIIWVESICQDMLILILRSFLSLSCSLFHQPLNQCPRVRQLISKLYLSNSFLIISSSSTTKFFYSFSCHQLCFTLCWVDFSSFFFFFFCYSY